MAQSKYYAVRAGRKPGIYRSWEDCKEQVDGFEKARYKSFTTEQAANDFLQGIEPKTTSKTPQNIKTDMIQVYTDGGSRNHGNKLGGHVKATDKSAWAYLIISPDGKRQSNSGSKLGVTNNWMELTALIEALTKLLADHQNDQPIQIISDSHYVLDPLTKNWIAGWQRRGWKKSNNEPVKNQELWVKLVALLKNFSAIRYIWTKGHATNQGNVFVDELLNKAMDQMGGAVQPTAPHHPTPSADPEVKRRALSDIQAVLNGSAAPA